MEYNENLFRNVVLYICQKAPKDKLGTVKLNKILWYFEKLCFDTFGSAVTGETYIKCPRGPVASHLEKLIDDLKNEKILKVRKKGEFEPTEYICRRPVENLPLNEKVTALLDMCIRIICDAHTSVTISRKSHDSVWRAAEMGEPLLFSAYYRTEALPDDEEMAWANACMENIYAESCGE